MDARNALTAPPVERFPARVYYPESDDEPMGETDDHVQAIFNLLAGLRHLLRPRSDVYVAADMFLYYEEGNPAAVKTPDVMVIKGVGRHPRRTFQLWVEGAAPCVVIEVTSRSTRLQDLGEKRALYEMLGVREYVLFDPLGEYLRPPLRGYRLEGEAYLPLTLRSDGALVSEELSCAFRPEGAVLRVVDLATGEPVPTLDESVDLIATALAAAAESDRQRQEADRQREEADRHRQEADRLRREAEAETERLRRLLHAPGRRADDPTPPLPEPPPPPPTPG